MIERNISRLSKFISNSSLLEVLWQLKYKCERKNKKYYQIEEHYPSTQICSIFGYKEREIKDLSVRFWECKECTKK